MNWIYKNIQPPLFSLRWLLLLVWLIPHPPVFAGTVEPFAAPPPVWSVNPDDYEFNMNMVIRVNYVGLPGNGANNIVGVFVGNELRGVSTPVISGGIAYYYTTIYSNTYVGEQLHFRFYAAADDAVFPAVEQATFRHNLQIGTAEAAFFINIDPNADFPPEILPIPADTTVTAIPFDPLLLTNYLVSLDGDPVIWSAQPGPNLQVTLVNGVLTVTPVFPAWTGTDSVRIIVTENTPGQLADTVYALFTVLPDYGPPVWQMIPDQTIFLGGMFTPFDLDNYLTFNGNCHQFDYDVFPFTGAVANPNWPAVPPGIQPMNMIVRPLFADEVLAGPGARLAAFVNGVLAGSASPTGVAPNIYYVLQLANVGAGPVTFRFYDAANQYLYEKTTNLVYAPGGTVGTIAAPYVLQLSPVLPALAANGNVTMTIVDPLWTGVFPVDFIVWDCRFPAIRRDTESVLFSIVADIRPQITSLATVNFEENACSVLYDAMSTDPTNSEGSGLTYTLAGGADAGRFAISAATGILTWATGFSPDFENPGDADMNNQYLVHIRVTNAANLSDTLALTVTVTNQATEPFAAVINNGAAAICATGTVTLQAMGGVSYLWNTGAAFSSIVVNTAGIYTVTVTSTGSCTATATVSLSPPPAISAAGSLIPVCTGAPVVLTSAPTGGALPYTTFVWTGPNGFTSALEDPLSFPATAAAAGVYTVQVTDAATCTATASTTIVVTAGLAPVITAGSNSPVCTGASLMLSSVPTGGSGIFTTYKWAGPNSFAAASQNPPAFPALPASAGTYTVTVTDNAGCTATASTAVVVKPAPVITAAGNSPVCTGGTIVLTSTPSGGSGIYNTFQWAGPNSFSAGIANPAAFPATPAASGTYTVTVTDNAGCSATATKVIAVNGLPSITAALLNPVCSGGMIALGATPTGGSGTYTTFLWTGPNGYTASVEDPAAFPATPANTGTYTVTVTDLAGCTASGSVTVVIAPVPSVTAVNNGPVCQGNNLTLSATPAGGSGAYSAFLWTGPDNYSATLEDPAPFSTTLASAGVYQVKVTDSQGCTATGTTTVMVRAKPVIAASSNAPLCTGAVLNLQSAPSGGSGVFSTFSWTGPNGFTAMTEDPAPFAVTIIHAGTYRVTVTDNNGCTATSSTSVAVSTFPAPTITAASNGPVCGGGLLTLSSTPSGGSGVFTAFSWAGPNNYSATQEDPAPFVAFANGTGVYTVTVTDNKNCKGTASVNVLVNGPLVVASSNSPVCPGGTVLLQSGVPTGPGLTFSWTGPNNFSSPLSAPSIPSATVAAAGTYTVTVTENGCSGAGSVTVAVGDNIPPVITCPANVTIAANTNCSGVVGTILPVSVNDNCNPNPVITQMPAASTVLSGHNDMETVTLTANDGNGNTANCSFTVTLKDVTPPTITCPANVTIAANGTCSGVVGAYMPVTLSDNCAANLLFTQSPVDNTVLSGHNDVETVTLITNDGNGNNASCTFTVTLKDVTPPSITCPANVTIAADAACSGVVGVYQPVSVSDNCAANPTVTQSPVSSTVLSGHNDVETVTLTANDGNGNTANCTFTVTLKDVTPPTITCPANVTIAADGNCSGVVGAYQPVAVGDNCTANPTVTQSPVSTTVLSGHNDVETITLTANDGNGNTTNCTFTVTLKDVTPPSITCPANVTLAADAACSGVVGVYQPIALSDNCAASPTVTQSPVATTVLSGHNDVETVTLTANDGNGNTASCTFTVTLKDVTPPSITCPANVTIAADATCSGVVGAYAAVAVSDNCAANPTVTQSPVASTVLLGHNDVETVTLTANDGNGNTASCTFTVALKDITAPLITCPANTTLAADANCSSPVGAYPAVSASDNCTPNPAVSQSPAPATVISGHNTAQTVTLSADDGNGNTTSCTFTVTLKDIIAPTVVCSPFTAPLNAAGTVTVLTANVFQSGADNCGTVNQVSVVPNSFTCNNLGANTVVLTVNDGNGNTASCSTTVTVVDNIPPTMLCNQIIVPLSAAGTASVTAAQLNNNSTDNCTLVSISLTPTSFTCANIGANDVTLTGVDQSGNTAFCIGKVIIVDNIPPTMLCKNATLNLDNFGQATLTIADINNGSFDNCTIVSLLLSQTSFNCAHLGNNTVVLSGVDQSGNSAACTAVVTVQDLILPVAICKKVIANLGPDGTVTIPPSAVNNGSSDNCSFTLSLSPATFTCTQVGANVAILTVTDLSGNTATCTSKVTVKDITPPIAICSNPTIYLDQQGNATLTVSQVNNGSTDNCGIVSSELNRTAFNCTKLTAVQNVSLTLRDAAGNQSVCIAAVTVKDTIPPTAVCQNTTVQIGSNGTVTVQGAVLAAGSFDNCAVTSYNPIVKVYNASNIGPNNLTITVKDISGNSASCVAVVNVLPPAPPPAAPSSQQRDSLTGGNYPDFHVLLYPNPGAGLVTIELAVTADQEITVQVLDLAGRQVQDIRFAATNGQNIIPMDLHLLEEGIYLVQVYTRQFTVQERLVLMRK